MRFLFRHSLNSRKLSQQKFDDELACAFTAHYTSKNVACVQTSPISFVATTTTNGWRHFGQSEQCKSPVLFPIQSKKVQILAFLRVIFERNVSCPHPKNRWSQANKQLFRWACFTVLLRLFLSRLRAENGHCKVANVTGIVTEMWGARSAPQFMFGDTTDPPAPLSCSATYVLLLITWAGSS